MQIMLIYKSMFSSKYEKYNIFTLVGLNKYSIGTTQPCREEQANTNKLEPNFMFLYVWNFGFDISYYVN